MQSLTEGRKFHHLEEGENPNTFTLPNFSKTLLKSSRETTSVSSLKAAAGIFSSA